VVVAGLAGAIAFGVISYVRMTDQVGRFERVAVPGSGELPLVAGHDYTVYTEHTDGSRPPVTVRITDPAGHPAHLRTRSGVTYHLGGHDGRAALTFHADQDGVYRLTAQGGPGTTVAVGDDLTPSIVRTVVGPIATFFTGFIPGVATIVTVVVRRYRYRRRLGGGADRPRPGFG
jgi:hypothetical protein